MGVSGGKGLHNSLLHDSAELCSAVKNHTVGERGIESNSNPTRFEDITVKKFFELESLPDDSKEITKSEEEIYCEEHFVSTYKRDKMGRFIVRLPIKENAETLLGYPKENAIKRLNGIWEKLNKNNTMGTLYKELMNEYELLGHMEEIKNETLDKINYYIPHHSVYKPEKTSTPLRVVFDASAKTTSGFSLNSILLNGGIIQQDLFSIVSRFRKHEYVFSADIKKCTGLLKNVQILVDLNQRDLQRIMWKTSADAPVKTYKLATVTYGTVSAPFLATRTLKALADEEKAEFPDAADVICNDSYMDDILSGESTLEGAKKLPKPDYLNFYREVVLSYTNGCQIAQNC
ncbi:DUF1758 domain-containing protein [Trichonephila clavipes]|nr:DUF1758 domain-containing protein [Trichonephila clavipes]